MSRTAYLKSALAGSASVLVLTGSAFAAQFNIPGGNLASALDAYAAQTGVQLLIADDAVRGAHTRGVKGDLSARDALFRILAGTGYTTRGTASGAVGIVRDAPAPQLTDMVPTRVAAASATSGIESVLVTAQKKTEDIQTVPIAVTALSSEQLQAMKVEGGPDLLKEIPNMTFSKTNFTGYNIQIRGIGTQAISVSTDPAVAVAFNGTSFIRNHLFEQEFFDVQSVEVLRGPQGTLYGRNATAGVVNVISAKPSAQWEASAKLETGNFNTRRLVGMINIPVVDDRFAIRVAGAWTKRNGYSFNETTGKPIDGRDLWSGRVTLGFRPESWMQGTLVWEHFQEADDRIRSAKQLCKKDVSPTSIGAIKNIDALGGAWVSQGCLPVSFYSPEAFETPNGNSLPYVLALQGLATGAASDGAAIEPIDPYLSRVQSPNLRVIESDLEPTYNVKNDVAELNLDFDVMHWLTFTSQTGYNQDHLHSTQDFNRFNTAPGIFPTNLTVNEGSPFVAPPTPNGIFCDPQLGCSKKLVAEDLSQEKAWQLSQEFRIASSFEGPLNFSLGGNYFHYETLEDYYVFINFLSLFSQAQNQIGYNGLAGVGDFTHCVGGRPLSHKIGNPDNIGLGIGCYYIDPNPITSLDGNGHNYFRSINPYVVNSYAGFGEVYYQLTPDVKLTGGLRWTDDKKHFLEVPSWVATPGWGYPVTSAVNQQWKEWTGRFVAGWTPKTDFTDQTLVYASYSRGYKGGGANPPGPAIGTLSEASEATHPLTFAPEFNNAYELGTKNTLLDGDMTLNGDIFYYDYKGYQISQIVDRTSINRNFDAKVKGLEIESTWEPAPGVRFNFAGGYEDSHINDGQSSIDLMDRTAGQPGWMVVKPWVQATSNCILPTSVVESLLLAFREASGGDATHPGGYASFGATDAGALLGACLNAYTFGLDPGTGVFGTGVPTGFDPATAPNDGAGFAKQLGGNQLPNTPHFTLSFGAQYGMPVSEAWTGVVRGDFYWQSQSFARVFNDRPYDKLRGWSNVNLSLMFINNDGWGVEGYVKNVFDTTAITGAFLNSDDTALTTNIFLTDPRLLGLNITKNW